jgi:type I restriction enzyme, S subunit
MRAWREVSLGEGLKVRHGYAFKGEHFKDHGDLIVLTPGNFIDGGGFKSKSGAEKYYDGLVPPGYLLSKGNVVVAMTEQSLGLLGSSATIPSDDRYLHNQRIGLLEIVDPEILDLRFVYHLMNSPDVRRQIQATATGTKVRHTAPERIRAVETRLPPLDVQRTIAAVLDWLDDLIENNRRRVEVLEEMARAIYREWFVHFRYPGRGTVELADSALGRIPEGWAIRPFAEVASFANGFAFKPNHWGTEGRPIIKIKQLKEGVTSDTPRCNESLIAPRYWVEPGALLFSWSADLGVYRWAGEPGLLNQHLFRVESSGQLSLSYLFYALDGAMSQFWNRAQGTTMRHIKRSALSEVVMAVPPPEVVDQFSSLVEPMDTSVLVCQRMSRNLESTRDILLFKLVTGQIDVSSFDLMALVEDSVA